VSIDRIVAIERDQLPQRDRPPTPRRPPTLILQPPPRPPPSFLFLSLPPPARQRLSLPGAGLGARKLLCPHLPHREDDAGEEEDRLILPYQLTVLPATAGAPVLSGAISVASWGAARGRHLPFTAASIYCTWSACSAAGSPPGGAAHGPT
jgi:hypothetical protein